MEARKKMELADSPIANGKLAQDIASKIGKKSKKHSILSIGSYNSILSIGSFNSVLSIGSSNSILSIGSSFSLLSLTSIASFGSILSFASFLSFFSALSTRGIASFRNSPLKRSESHGKQN
ncbi:MAG: hypothetical protein HXX08_04585 [Chloroflexi bacterium]|uniref:Uncharacterized protein n=1 Tax=Candidatus Chlorohelix allophototropha TaxID=3003348 RepID=A0A8T7LSY2_9CHLR|nr:hypothetical protein [Chloroflexota bacterium]